MKVPPLDHLLAFMTEWRSTLLKSCNDVATTLTSLLSQRQILGTGNLPQDSAPVCINIDISPEIAAQSAQRNQAFCVTASDWSPITSE